MSRPLAKWLLLIALLTYAALMAAFAATQVHTRRCAGLRVEILDSKPGAPRLLSPKAVERELGDLPRLAKGYPLTAINTDALERRLLAVNNFETAECAITSDGYLLVRVTPIVPEARVFTPTGTYYINAQGKRLDAHAEYFADLPVLQGNFSPKMPASAALPVVRLLRTDSLMANLVTMIDYRSPSNIILIPRIRGHVINLGDTTRLPEKVKALRLFYEKVMSRRGWDMYDTISVKFKGQVVATRRIKTRADHSTHFDDADPDPEEASALDQTKPIDTPDTPTP